MQIDNINLQFAYENFQTRMKEVNDYILFISLLSEMNKPEIIDKSLKSNSVTTSGLGALGAGALGLGAGALSLGAGALLPAALIIRNYLDSSSDSSCSPLRLEVHRDLQKTLRATTYLLLYNLMESTMSEAINAIYETIKEEKHDILDLSENLHKVILTSFQKGLTNEKISEYSKGNTDIRSDLLNLGYDKKKLFSGNIDCTIIDDYCKKYGFRPYVYKENNQPLKWESEIIKKIKQKRNSLAHGSESFTQCGQNMAIDTVSDNLQSVKAVLMAVFNGLNDFLNNKKYLRNP